MTPEHQHLTITQLLVPVRSVDARPAYALEHRLQPYIARHCGIAETDIVEYTILRRSLDARRKPDLSLLFRVRVTVRAACLVRDDPTIQLHTPPPDQNHSLYQLTPRAPLPKQPIIVGSGPAGMMAAYLLALHGCQPIVIDRGSDVVRRQHDIDVFLHTRTLDPESNYLFGEGGAGTFSDGKLYTRIKDHRIAFLLDAYVAARAPRRIRYEHHPHVGSDILPYMVKRLRQQIETWGGSFLWNTHVADLLIRNGRCCGVKLNNQPPLEGPFVLIGCGHSARDLIRTLIQHGVAQRGKDFQIGCRIEHPQALIDQAQYGGFPPRNVVGAAEYSLISRPMQKGKWVSNVTTFCMCPGGEIIPATSDPGQLCTNGMSRFRRNGLFANAGLIVNQDITGFPSPLHAFDFLSALEREAFATGGGDYTAPAQSALAFVRGEDGVPTAHTSYPFGLTAARLDRLLPAATVNALRVALRHFEQVLPGFMREGLLIGVETRVSSPVRFERQPETLASSLPGLYLAGEGAGYAGGITSSALDGLRIAETILTGAPARRKVE